MLCFQSGDLPLCLLFLLGYPLGSHPQPIRSDRSDPPRRNVPSAPESKSVPQNTTTRGKSPRPKIPRHRETAQLAHNAGMQNFAGINQRHVAMSLTGGVARWSQMGSKELDWVRRGRDSIRRPSFLRVATSDRIAFNESQQNIFNGKVEEFLQPLPLEIVQRLESIVGSVPELGPDSRVMDVGSGTGCLIPCLQSKGVSDILAVDISPDMCAQLEEKFPNPGVVGNELGVRVWCGDIVDIPDFMGPVDCIFMNAVFGNFFDVEEALLRCALMLRPGGKIVISHPLGRNWQSALHAKYPKMVPHALPDREGMESMIRGLPLEVHEWKDESDLYVAVLEVPPFYAFKRSPLFLEGKVVVGMGRGSKQMGVPTANVDPVPLKEQLESISQGVYFGWAQLQCDSNFSPEDGGVFPMVMNVGNRPTIEDEGEVTVEAHILHDYGKDFHGENLKLCALGFLRPEVKFPGLDALIARIKADIGMSKSQLQAEEMGAFKANPFFS